MIGQIYTNITNFAGTTSFSPACDLCSALLDFLVFYATTSLNHSIKD